MNEATAPATDAQLLIATCRVGSALFGIDTARVQEVVRAGEITRVHRSPACIRGVMNLRGRIVTVVDLGARLELGRADPGADSRIFIVDWETESVGLLVDCVEDVVTVARRDLVAPPENVRGVHSALLQGVCQPNGTPVALLDVDAVLRDVRPSGAVART